MYRHFQRSKPQKAKVVPLVVHRKGIPKELRHPFAFSQINEYVSNMTQLRDQLKHELVNMRFFHHSMLAVDLRCAERKIQLISEVRALDAKIAQYKFYLQTLLPPIYEVDESIK